MKEVRADVDDPIYILNRTQIVRAKVVKAQFTRKGKKAASMVQLLGYVLQIRINETKNKSTADFLELRYIPRMFPIKTLFITPEVWIPYK